MKYLFSKFVSTNFNVGEGFLDMLVMCHYMRPNIVYTILYEAKYPAMTVGDIFSSRVARICIGYTRNDLIKSALCYNNNNSTN